MKYIIATFFSTYFLALLLWGPLWALPVCITTTIVAGYLYARLSYRYRLQWYGDRLENIYEWQTSKWDKSVILRAQEHERWLELSGNEMGVRVVTIFFQDAQNPSEAFDEYLERVKQTIALDRALRHQEIEKQQGRDYYLREMHGQRGIRLPEEGEEPPSFWAAFFTAKNTSHEETN